MKKQIIFLVLVFLLMSRISYGDVIPDHSHYVTKCVKIINIDDYPDVSLVGFIHPWSMGFGTYLISSSVCLDKGYRFNDFNVYAVNKAYLTGKDINQMDLPKDPNAMLAYPKIEPYCGYVNDSLPISGLEQYYKIVGFSNTKVVLYLWKEVTKFNDGKPDLTKTYTYDGEISLLSQKITVGINSLQNHPGIELYPNPAQKNFHVKINNSYLGTVPLELVTMGGKVVKSMNLNKSGIILDSELQIANIAKGAYLVNLKFGKIVESRKIVIK